MRSVRDFLQDESGATSMEYALIASLIAVVIITGVRALGVKVSGKYGAIGSALT